MIARIIVLCIALVGSVSIAHAQTTPAPSAGARRAVGVFLQTCLNFAGSTLGLRDFLKKQDIPELNPQGRAIFVRDHVGIGFDASNNVGRLAIVSEDNGVCSIFTDQGNLAQIIPLIEVLNKTLNLQLQKTGGKETGSVHARYYTVTMKDHTYLLVISESPNPNSTIQAAMTLSPQSN
ncbi:MAG: hypothetical protein ABSE22_06420 [Xanthobacteraceae bacterium]